MFKVSTFFANRVTDAVTLKYLFYLAGQGSVENVVISNPWCVQYLQDPTFLDTLKGIAADTGVTFGGAHAPFGEGWDLGTADPERRKSLLDEQSRCLAFAAELGSKTITMHPGALPEGKTMPEFRDLVRASLEFLLPFAEKYGIVLCIENAMRATNTPDELLRYFAEFKSPWFGCTFDTGHANVMNSANGTKDPTKYTEKFLKNWPDGLVFEDHAFEKLASHVVVAHVHNNNGYRDEHKFVTDGTLAWRPILHGIAHDCPRILSIECEANSLVHLVALQRLGQEFRTLVALV